MQGKEWQAGIADPDDGNGNGNNHIKHVDLEDELPAASASQKIGDLCPECGEAAVVNEEGCRKCYACGYSE